ncbi:signal recognition particle-docking protein FtsY [Acidipropionibacterium acidipropionici]|uniref:Signal recognition particle receptor FtsY n=1 Tax=Acidipropionibacterium acidipropionici TaxID=1748 RepID=A0AAC9AN04_9ACTN|nr:signal recognition particle-docking protein FtsY [Acidipropionibacterium acidipropionici]AMS04782.1 signal recognition particle-docking protein FtsY [Acidipropionibacterium acidipropionici]AOZ46270.1 signal recognition particle-docking protein FtsY [Acidipropionibacterium acidipropionici]AZP37700.1 signal recognition particle-docking protein FtsY [Acidipropionibacterium acidipropionici]
MSADLVILLILIVLAAAIAVSTVVALYTRRKNKLPARPTAEVEAPEPEKKAPEPEAGTPEPELAAPAVVEAPALEEPEAPASRMARLRRRLAGSNNALARGLAQLLSADRIDDDTWDDFETTLITSDLGVAPTTELVEKLRGELAIDGVSDPERARSVLTRELTALVSPDLDRSLNLDHPDGKPAVVMMVGVNGTGKTTTCGKLARVLVAEGRTVLLGAADTFRAAAGEQLETWGERVGVRTVRKEEGADPASVAYEAVEAGIEEGVDVVLIDTAGRLHTKTGLMDELGKVKRVIEKLAPVSEVLLVLDATTGQNGLIQARIFSEVVDVSGIVLSKLDGSAKGGIVVQVQRELGVPVKLIGLGEGADDLAPFEPDQFVAGLMGE